MLPIGIEGYQANSALKEFHVGSSNIVSTSNGVVVFDPRVDNLSLLLAGLRPGLQAHVLERDRDGVQQIADLLQDHPTDSLILVTHGFPGGMQLGSGTLEHSNLYRYGAQIQKWFEKSRSPQLTLLACHVAAGDVGKAFISQLCEWTGATLIATAALVGNGDWPQTADSLFDTAVLKSYTATLEIGFETFLRDGVDGIEGLAGVNSVAVSPDGRHVFVTAEAISGRRTGTLAVFDRNLTSGRLTINAIFDESIDDVDGLSGVSAVTTSPDGRQVFVTSSLDRALTVFDRDPVSGQLTLNSIIQNSSTSGPFITGISAIAASPDGRQLFVTGYSNDSLAVFDRDPISGAWALTREFNDDAEGIDGLRQATSVAISRDGRQVFVAGTRDNALAVFDRNPESGEVSFRTIFRDDSLNLIDIETEGLDGLYQARFVTTSPDDKQVFVVSEFENALAVFRSRC